jgi:glutamate racemase
MLHNNGPIGLFDSGLGGLTVLREVRRMLPDESVIYFGDTAHVPYGSRPVQELIELADRIVSYLTQQGAKYLIFACNTSSALSLPILRKIYQPPMLGIIVPGAAEAAKVTLNKLVGVMATEATINSGA